MSIIRAFLACVLFAFAPVAHAQSGSIVFGSGKSASGPSISCTAIPNFGSQNVGVTSPPQISTCTNNSAGGALLQISTVAFGGGSSSTFTLGSTNTCPTTGINLAVGASCNVAVVFTPTSATTFSGSVVVTAAAGTSGSPVTLTLGGTGFTCTTGCGGSSTYTAPTDTTASCTLAITNTALTSNVAVYTYTASTTCLPVATLYLNISGTTNGGGVFNGTNLQVTSVGTTCSAANTFCVAITHANVTSAADTGSALAHGGNPPYAGLPSTAPLDGTGPFSDSDYVHSSSGGICGNNYTCWWPCAGPTAIAAIHATYPTFPLNADFLGAAGGQETIFSADDAYVYYNIRAGNPNPSGVIGVFMSVNTTAGSCSVGRVLLGSTGISGAAGVMEASRTGGSDVHIYYGYPNGGVAGFETIDAGTGTVTTLLNVNTSCNLPAGVTITVNGGGVGNSGDQIASGHDNVIGSWFGIAGQTENSAEFAIFYQRASGGCGWWDVYNDKMGSNGLWTGGWPSCASACTGIHAPAGGHAGLHAVGVDASAQYASITLENGVCASPAICTPPTGCCSTVVQAPVILQLGSQNANYAAWLSGHGHFSDNGPNLASFTSGTNTSGLNCQIITVALNNPTALVGKSSRIGPPAYPCVDGHPSGVMIPASGTSGTIGMNTYCAGITNNCNGPTPPGPGSQEPINIDFSGNNYRFMRTYMNQQIANGDFYSETTGNWSSDGKYETFPSNWNGTVNGGTLDPLGNPAYEMFITELR